MSRYDASPHSTGLSIHAAFRISAYRERKEEAKNYPKKLLGDSHTLTHSAQRGLHSLVDRRCQKSKEGSAFQLLTLQQEPIVLSCTVQCITN